MELPRELPYTNSNNTPVDYSKLPYDNFPKTVPPPIWGPTYWQIIHSFANSYPYNPTDSDKSAAKKFYTDLVNKLPCKTCGDSYAIFIQRMPIDNYLDNKDKLMWWTYKLHTIVNDKLRSQGKPKAAEPTWTDFCKKYNSLCYSLNP